MLPMWKKLATAVLPLLVSMLALSGCEPGAAPPLEPAFSTTGTLKRVQKSIQVFTAAAVIGAEGGVIGNSDFQLTVPAGALDGPTTFTISSLNSGYLELELTATGVNSSIVNNVGAAGFKVPLSFRLSYSGSNAWTDNLVMVWVRPDGTLEPVTSQVDTSKKLVTGQVAHFSAYGLAGN